MDSQSIIIGAPVTLSGVEIGTLRRGLPIQRNSKSKNDNGNKESNA